VLTGLGMPPNSWKFTIDDEHSLPFNSGLLAAILQHPATQCKKIVSFVLVSKQMNVNKM